MDNTIYYRAFDKKTGLPIFTGLTIKDIMLKYFAKDVRVMDIRESIPGILDNGGRRIYRGDTVRNTRKGFEGVVEFQPQAGQWHIVKTESPNDFEKKVTRYLELCTGEMTGSEDIMLNDVEIIFNSMASKL